MAQRRTSYMAHRDSEPLDPDDALLGFTPAPHVAPRRNSITPERQRAFIAHLAASGIVAEAARHIGASLEALYKLRNKPGAEEFAAAWDEAVDRGVLRIEHGALQRAIEGVDRPIVSGGKLLGWHRVHNEPLVMFLLRQRQPERYGAAIQLALRPGHPLYDRIKREVLAEDDESEEEVLESLDRFIEDMRERRVANAAILAEAREREAREAGDAPDGDEAAPTPLPRGPRIRTID